LTKNIALKNDNDGVTAVLGTLLMLSVMSIIMVTAYSSAFQLKDSVNDMTFRLTDQINSIKFNFSNVPNNPELPDTGKVYHDKDNDTIYIPIFNEVNNSIPQFIVIELEDIQYTVTNGTIPPLIPQ